MAEKMNGQLSLKNWSLLNNKQCIKAAQKYAMLYFCAALILNII